MLSLRLILLLAPASMLCATPALSEVLAPPVDPISLDSQDDPKPDKRPEVKELLSQLKGHAGKRGKEDKQAVAVVDSLVVEFQNSGRKDRASIAKGVASCFKQKRPEKNDFFNSELYNACAVALGTMGPESAAELTDWIGHKTLRKDVELQRRLILSLGKTRVEKSVKDLEDLLNDKSPTVQAAAGEALGNYTFLKAKERKKVFEAVLKILTSAKNAKDSDPLDTIAAERYNAISASMVTTLQVLSGEDLRDPSKWRTWWNKNKKRDWDKED